MNKLTTVLVGVILVLSAMLAIISISEVFFNSSSVNTSLASELPDAYYEETFESDKTLYEDLAYVEGIAYDPYTKWYIDAEGYKINVDSWYDVDHLENRYIRVKYYYENGEKIVDSYHEIDY
jgi:hypothetical protein